ncbi:MAG: EAL domain-containing protein [Actinomycetota bacterium]
MGADAWVVTATSVLLSVGFLGAFLRASKGAARLTLTEQSIADADASWAPRIRKAIRRGSITLAFQPIVSVRTGAVAHYEVLARMVADDGTLIDAAEFIPTAERCGLVSRLDRLVVDAALVCLARAHATGARAGYSINLSGLSLCDTSTIEHITKAIATSGVDPSALTFEITETAAIANLSQARRSMQTLRDMGCRFALDDFGKGLSSFTYLRYLPVDALKIDGAFLRNFHTDPVNQAMVRAMTDLARTLGLETIAECVEDPASMKTLRALGVGYAQGNYLGRPSIGTRRPNVSLAEPAHAPRTTQTLEVHLPERTPCELIEFVAFLDDLDRQLRGMRDAGQLPASQVTRPDEFDHLVADLVGRVRAQASEALAAGDRFVRLRLPLTRRLVELVAWTEPRIQTLVGLSETGAVPAEWERSLTMMAEVFEAVRAQLPRPVALSHVPTRWAG